LKNSVRYSLIALIATVSALAQPTVSAVANGFSFQPHLSPGVLASVFGANLAGTNPTTVVLNGIDCPVTFTSAAQLNIQVPWEAAIGAGHLTVTVDGSHSAPFSVSLATYSPALVSLNGSGSGTGEFFSGPNLIGTSNPANGGDVLLTYGIGLGPTNPAIATGEITPNPPPLYVTVGAPALTVGGKAATISFSGLAPGALATDQINFTLPALVPTGDPNVIVTIGSATSPPVTIPVGCKQVNSQVTVTKGKIEHASGNLYTQAVKIQNKTSTNLPTNASLVLTTLTSSAKLSNGGGATCPSSDGSPFKSFSFTGTGTSQTATVTLAFTDSTTGTIAYGVRVLVP